MPAPRALYREILLDHGKQPRNHAPLEDATHEAAADNPLCGDRVRIQVAVEGDRLRAARFTMRGCLLATASASLMTEAVRGRSLDEVSRLCANVEATCHGRPAGDDPSLGALSALAAVRDYPGRRRCATLPWAALRQALAQPQDQV